jgi:hypothetical protein
MGRARSGTANGASCICIPWSYLPAPRAAARVLVPLEDAGPESLAALQAEGGVTVGAVAPCADWRAEARRLGCGYVLENRRPRAVDDAV